MQKLSGLNFSRFTFAVSRKYFVKVNKNFRKSVVYKKEVRNLVVQKFYPTMEEGPQRSFGVFKNWWTKVTTIKSKLFVKVKKGLLGWGRLLLGWLRSLLVRRPATARPTAAQSAAADGLLARTPTRAAAPRLPLGKRLQRFGLKLVKRTAIGLVALFFLFMILNWLFPLPDKIEYSTIITDDKGNVIFASLTSDQKWRMKTELNEISPLLQKTLVEKEDKYFWSHPGVNPVAMVKSGFKDLVQWRRASGASTITMQVARMLEKRPRTLLSKLIECFRAFQLEWKYSKKEILQMYVNLAPYGGNVEGVKSASVIYLNKMPDHLSLAEITALSIIPNRPVSLVPGRNNDRIVEDRNRWLRKFARDKHFTEKEITDALNEPFNARRSAVPFHAPHLAYRLRRQLQTENIATHIHLEMQQKIEQLVADHSRSLYLKNIRNAAVVVIDNTTHRVVTYVGSANFKDTIDAGQVNGATAIRQPGSTLKPLLYGLCVDNGLLTPKQVVNDVAVNFSGYAPENFDKRFNGYVTMEYALDHSLNIPAVKALNQLGKEKMIAKLSDCNFSQVRKDQHKLGLSLILGGCGTTLEELTGLFSVFANNGVYIQPSYSMADTAGRRSRILSEAANFMIAEMLSKVNRPDFPLNWQSSVHLPKIAWKTGTSYGRRDAWSIGFNQKYTVGVWVGNFSGASCPELSGAEVATPLLFKVFNTINYDADQQWFTPPAACQQRKVCSVTGLPPNNFCTDQMLDYFIPLTSSNIVCRHKQEILTDEKETVSYCKSCQPATGYKKKLYTAVSPEMQKYFEDNQLVYEKIPPHNPQCERVFAEGAPAILSLGNGSEYLISKSDPEPLMLSCQAETGVSKVYWYINNQLFKAAGAKEKIFFNPEEGPIKISCTDDKGRNRDIWITVKKVNM
jgi:penicillin-binding protein 1C